MKEKDVYKFSMQINAGDSKKISEQMRSMMIALGFDSVDVGFANTESATVKVPVAAKIVSAELEKMHIRVPLKMANKMRYIASEVCKTFNPITQRAIGVWFKAHQDRIDENDFSKAYRKYVESDAYDELNHEATKAFSDSWNESHKNRGREHSVYEENGLSEFNREHEKRIRFSKKPLLKVGQAYTEDTWPRQSLLTEFYATVPSDKKPREAEMAMSPFAEPCESVDGYFSIARNETPSDDSTRPRTIHLPGGTYDKKMYPRNPLLATKRQRPEDEENVVPSSQYRWAEKVQTDHDRIAAFVR